MASYYTAELELMNGFTNYNETVFGKAVVSWNGDGMIFVKGMLRPPAGTVPTGTVMAKIPNQATGAAETNVFQQNTKNGSVRLDVKAIANSHTEIIYNNGSGTMVDWISLAGINYDCMARG